MRINFVFILCCFFIHCANASSSSLDFIDADGDGYGAPAPGAGVDSRFLRQTSDPDDTDPSVSPIMYDWPDDGIDQNGDGIDGPALDRYGGWVGIKLKATGFFRVEKVNNRWWFVTPDGHPYFFNSVQGIGKVPGLSDEDFQQGFLEHGYNGFDGYGKYDTFPNFVENNFFPRTVQAPELFYKEGSVKPRDYFTDEWMTELKDTLVPLLETIKDRPEVLGIALGEEFKWLPDMTRPTHMFDEYMMFDEYSPGKSFLVDFLVNYYDGDINAFNLKWDQDLASFEEVKSLNWLGPKSLFNVTEGNDGNAYDIMSIAAACFNVVFGTLRSDKILLSREQADVKDEFAALLVEQYYKSYFDLIRTYAPNHLIISHMQILISGSKRTVKMVAKYSDVYGINPYPTNFVGTAFGQILSMATSGGYVNEIGMSSGFGTDQVSDLMALIGDKPMVMEFGVVGDDYHHYNDKPGNFTALPSQKTRAEYMEKLYDLYLQSNQVVGVYYYNWGDQQGSTTTIGNGYSKENNQVGIVNEDGVPYPYFGSKLKELNKWWLVRVRTSDQNGLDVLEPVKISTGLSTGSVTRMKTMRSGRDFIFWALDAWSKQDFYSKAKSMEFFYNVIADHFNLGLQRAKHAQLKYGYLYK